MLTILFASPMRMRRSSLLPFCASSTFSLTVIMEMRRYIAPRLASTAAASSGLPEEPGSRPLGGLRGVLENDALGLLASAALFLFPADPLLLPPPLLLLEELLAQLVEAPTAVRREVGIAVEGLDERRLAEQSNLVHDEGVLGRSGHLRGQAQERLVRGLRVADDPLEHEVVVGRPADRVELGSGRGSLEEAEDVVERQEREGRPGGGPDLGVLVGHDREEGPHPVVPLERQQAAGREEAQIARRVRRPDDRDEVLRLDCGRRVGLDYHRGEEPRASFASGAGPARACRVRPGPRSPGAPWRGRRR